MKKQYVSLLAIILTTSGFLFSCGSKTNKNKGALEFDSIQINEVAHLFGDTAKPGCNLSVSFVYSDKAANKELMDSVNKYLISICFDDEYSSLSSAEAAQKYKDNYIKEYRKDLEPSYMKDVAASESIEDIGSWYSYYHRLQGKVEYYKSSLLVYCVFREEFTGGAHGTYSSKYYNINLNSMNPIRLEDIFVDEYKEMLTDLLWNQLMIDNNVESRKDLEEMGYAIFGDLEPSENFFINDKGITFHYNIYEIAPYVMGNTQICLPYEIMEHLLNEEFIILKEIRNNN